MDLDRQARRPFCTRTFSARTALRQYATRFAGDVLSISA
jgi:hypothetical protein